MVWHDMSVGSWHFRYTKTEQDKPEFVNCDSNGTPLKKVGGSFNKGYYVNEKTGEKVDKAFKLINGKASAGFKGRIKNTDKFEVVEQDEAEDVLVEHTYLVDSNELYNELNEKGKAVRFNGWFGNGYCVYRCYITPSKMYKGWCLMKAGTGSLKASVGKIIKEDSEQKALKKRLQETSVASNVAQVSPEEMMAITLQAQS